MKFVQFHDCEAQLEWMVDGDWYRLQLESQNVSIEDADPFTLWFARQLLKLFCVGKEPCVSVLGLILAVLTVNGVVH